MIFIQVEHLIEMANGFEPSWTFHRNGQWYLVKWLIIFSQVENLIKMASDIYSKWPMIFNQMKHLTKMANDL